MKKIRKLLSIILIASILYSLFSGLFTVSYAAAEAISISVASYSSGTLTISWDAAPSGTSEVLLFYHTPNVDNPTYAEEHSETIPLGTNSATITGLKNDYIYDIDVQMRSSSSTTIGEGFLYFLPGITFTSTIVKENISDTEPYDPEYDSNGGREIGTKPQLQLQWNIPRVYGSSTTFELATDAYAFMATTINNVYNGGIGISALDFIINISTKVSDMSLCNSVIISGGQAYVSGYESNKQNVSTSDDVMSIYLLGKASADDDMPSTTTGVLAHEDILPGTVYYMTIQSVFTGYTDAVTTYNSATALEGKPYTYTPIRFQLSKDDEDNLYVKVYTVNNGSLSLPDLYYEVQTNTVDSQNGWVTKAKIDPDYFRDSNGDNLEFGIIPITGISANNNIYYRIVASSSSTDTIKSQNLPYRMALDKSRPPVPKDITIISKTLVTGTDGQKSSNVTISWDKPSNWDEIQSNTDTANDTYICIVLNISQSEISEPLQFGGDDGNIYKFPATYRLVRYINARSYWNDTGTDPSPDSDKIVGNGDQLEYTLKGLKLFKYTGDDGTLVDFPTSLQPEDGYPDYLLPNLTYYMQMYTTKGVPGSETSSSERSVTVSFTTLSSTQKDVPLPDNFMLMPTNGNTCTTSGGIIINTIRLQFDMIDTDNIWADYDSSPSTTAGNILVYDLYMSTNPESVTNSAAAGFVRIGSTDPDLDGENNVDFGYVVGDKYDYVVTTISAFTLDPAVTAFGDYLTPNTTYYFKLITRLVMPDSDPAEIDSSVFTRVLSVTTVKGSYPGTEGEVKTPLAPTDFKVSTIAANSVAFEWPMLEEDVSYSLVCTSVRLDMNAADATITGDALYQSFKEHFAFSGLGIAISPTDLETDIYQLEDGIFSYTVNEWLDPNTLYYFSLRAERRDGSDTIKSSWISIPVTTTLLEAPANLEAINDAEIGFFWTDTDNNTAEDYTIYLKGPSDTEFKVISRSQCSVVRDSKTTLIDQETNYIYYGRVYNLKINTSYSVAVYKGTGSDLTLVYQDTGLYTKDGYHQIMVKWKGVTGYSYEVAVRAADAEDYTTLDSTDLESYTDVYESTNPYYYEETTQTNKTDYGYYFARIKSIPVTLADGRIKHQELESNTSYYVRVRAVKSGIELPSKYTEPVQTRTEFSQEDYDDEEEDEDNENLLLNRVKELEEKLFWRMDISNSGSDKVLLKGGRVENVIENSGSFPVSVDISGYATSAASDVVYIPEGVADALQNNSKELTVITSGASFTFGPGSLSTENTTQAALVEAEEDVNELFLKATMSRAEYPQSALPADTKRVSEVSTFGLQVLGSTTTNGALEAMIQEELYDADTGLVSKKATSLTKYYSTEEDADSSEVSTYIDELVDDIEVELSDYISTIVEGSSGNTGIMIESENITKLGGYVNIKLPCGKASGLKQPYALYGSSSEWRRITKSVSIAADTVGFYANMPGKFMILVPDGSAADISEDYWARESIEALTSKFDLTEVFTGFNKSYSPESPVSVKEAVLLYEKIMGKASDNLGESLKQKAARLGLGSYLNINTPMKNVTREQTAVLLARLYSGKSGTNTDKLNAGRVPDIRDENSISDMCFNYVCIVVDKSIMTVDDNRNFSPKTSVTRASLIVAAVRLLKLVGEM
jgi:hypothetical protein